MKWWLAKGMAMAAAVMLLISVVPTTAFAVYENTHLNTGDQAMDIVAVAETQLGYLEGTLEGTKFIKGNYTKYGVWYDENVQSGGFSRGAWCAMFVSWCAYQAGIPTQIVYYHAYCPYGVAWYQERGLYHASQAKGGTYIPKRGDIIYCRGEKTTGPGHVGIVRDCDQENVYTIEGNTDSMDKILKTSGGVFEKHIRWTAVIS